MAKKRHSEKSSGESIEELAEDYGRSRSEIQEAIRCELWLEAA